MSDLLNQPITEQEASRRALCDMRRRIARNEAIPEEELAEALLLIRKNFGSEVKAKAKAKAKKTTAKKPAVDVDGLLDGLIEGL